MRIKGPGVPQQVRGATGRESGLTPQRPYEATGSIPRPAKGGQARNTRTISGPSLSSASEGPSEPKYNRGPSRSFRKTT